MSTRMVKVVNPDGDVTEMTMANARDVVNNLGFKFYSAADEPKEQNPVVGEQKSVEDAVAPKEDETPAPAGDPSPEDLAPATAKEEAPKADEDKADAAKKAAAAAAKPKSKGK